MAVKLGMQCKIYRNTGTYGTPVWAEISNCKDVTLNLETGEADVTTRANNGWKATAATLKDGSIEFESLWNRDDEGFKALKRAYFQNEPIEVAVMDGAIDQPGVEGLRATVSVTNLSRSEPLEEAISASVTLKPTAAAHAPFWYETEVITAAEPTTAAGANLYWNDTTKKATFTALGNAFIGQTVQDYTTAGTIVYFDSTADEV
jgi:predicted secreted protein